jgi:primosomal protein N' (replication factor Y)
MSAYFDLLFDIPAKGRFTYRVDEKAEAQPGKRAMVPFGKRSKESLGYIVAERDSPPAGIDAEAIKTIRRVVDKEPVFDQSDLENARWMAAYYFCSEGQALAAMIPSGRRESFSTISNGVEEPAEKALELSSEQEAALCAIISGTEKNGDAPAQMFYLYGITGSGKTEVFLRASEHLLKTGKSVIYLVPEISLTRQTAEIIGRRFGSTAATLHSGMSPSVRLAEWNRIRSGEARIVVGPRSAVFAPVQNLGLIIIDEEHDGSYKSGSTPRYHARQMALRRCQTSGARLVMGSATPSAEAWKHMADGAIKRLDLSRRLAGGSMPEIKTVSLERSEGCLTAELKEEIRITAQMGRQSILFLNRRGFAHFYHCPNCGCEQTCRHCSVSLTWHKSRGGSGGQGRAVCHYCGYSEAPPAVCPKCGSLEAGYRGFGTEMIEEEVKRTFPELRIRRADADTAGKNGGIEESLRLFRSGEIDVLLGTQMVAKGLNFPGVRLVGVVFADTGLQLPDFRAAERVFSLLVQVAGRAGRYFPDGKVIVQTLRMNDPVITRSCALDVEGFFSAELEHRKLLGFPPFSRVIRFTVRAKEANRADAAIRRLAGFAQRLLPPAADMLGPAECPIGIIAGNHRRHLMLRGPVMGTLHAAARLMLEQYEKNSDSRVFLEVDVDPVSVL